MANRKLTDEELANVRTFVPAECVGLLMYVDLMAAEIRSLRAAPVISEEERAALTLIPSVLEYMLYQYTIRAAIDGTEAPKRETVDLALAVLDRLLSAGKETL